MVLDRQKLQIELVNQPTRDDAAPDHPMRRLMLNQRAQRGAPRQQAADVALMDGLIMALRRWQIENIFAPKQNRSISG